MFGTNAAFWFSPSGTKIAFARFDNTAVENFQFTKYGEPGRPADHRYTQIESIPYPKVSSSYHS